MTITILILRVIPMFEAISQQNQMSQAFIFSNLERITDTKKNDKSQSFIGKINHKKYIVFAPVHFQVGLSCSGEGELQSLDTNETLKYYFLSQKIENKLMITTLTCQNYDFFSPQYIRDIIHKQFAIYQTTGELYFILLFGGGSNTPLIETSVWQSLGIIHLISLSGLQVSIILSHIARLYHFFPLGETKRKILNSILLIWYGFICWNSLPFIRIIVVKLFEEWGSNLSRLTAQILTTYIFLCIWPECFYNIGFWFSVLMQYTLIYIDLFISKYQPSKLIRFGITACCLFLTTLIISFTFHLPISAFFLLTNMLFIPLFEYILLPMMIIGILLFPMQSSVTSLLSITQIIFQITLYYIQNCYIYAYEALIALNTCIITIAAILYHKNIKYIIANIFLSTALIISSLVFIPRTTETTLIFMNVGQGDSSILFLAQTQTLIVVDTGAPNSHYLQKLKQHLYSLGKSHIDYLIITHEDSDHSGNAKTLLLDAEIQPDTLILPNTTRSDTLLNLAATHKKKTLFVDKTTPFLSEITFLNPGYHLSNENEESIVFQLKFGENHILYQADAGEEFEKANQTPILPLSILKVSHHGSKGGSSETYIKAIKPQYSIISAGKHNRYGHPHKEIISRLNTVQSTILQTSEQGDIKFQCTANNCYQST